MTKTIRRLTFLVWDWVRFNLYTDIDVEVYTDIVLGVELDSCLLEYRKWIVGSGNSESINLSCKKQIASAPKLKTRNSNKKHLQPW